MKKTNLLMRGTALSLALFSATPAFAQNDSVAPSDAAEDANDRDVIVVTGSRILNRPNLEASIPITSVDADDLLNTGEISLGDMLNRLPQLRSTFTQANSTASIGTSGLNLLDLRGLGTSRTLVLVNGRRSVTSTPGTYRVDTNTIPTELLERVDLVTGGNSAVYGSDAVSGVVNFILKRDYEGIGVNAQGGVSSRGDRGSYSINGVIGRNFADGRGNIAISGGYARSETLLFADRNAQTGAFTGTPGFATVDSDIQCSLDSQGNPIPGSVANCDPNVRNASDGIPDTAFFDVFPGATFGNASLGGAVLFACPAATATNAAQRALVCAPFLTPTGGRVADNYMFAPDGSLLRNNPAIDLRPFGGGVRGGRGASGVEGAMLLPGLSRYNTTLLARYEFSPAVEVFFEGKYVNITANQTSTQPVALSLGGTTSTFFLDNPFLTPQARSTIQQALGTTSSTAGFSMIRFLNDVGTRSEQHKRETWGLVGGLRGDISSSGNLRYEVALNWGRTETYYEAGGHFVSAKFNNAVNAVRNAQGDIVCRINADASTTNDDASCRPINLFGEGAPLTTPDGLAYARYTPFRDQWAEMLNATAFISGDTSGLFELPGGPIGFAVGVEYRKEDAFSAYDDITAAGRGTLNSFADFAPPAITSKEIYGEIRIPLLADAPLAKELSIELSGRASDYSNIAKKVYAYNAGVIYSPFDGVRLRAGYARSVRTPNLSDAYATRTETFANNLVDPCSQTVISQNPNRTRNCAAAGVPTVLQLPDGTTQPWINTPSGGISGFNQGNPDLEPEVGKNLTIGGVFQPRFLPGFSLSVDYYRIKINKAIAGLTGQTIINQCYDDTVGIDNVYCAAISRRTTSDPLTNATFSGQSGRNVSGLPIIPLDIVGPAFINQPFNYASFKASGIDAQMDYSYRFENGVRVTLSGALSWVENREFFTSVADPTFSDRVHGELGDPIWEGSLGVNVVAGPIDFDYDFRWIGKQAIATWETQHSHQGREPLNADAFPVKYYPSIGYVDMQVGYTVDQKFRFHMGVDNVFDTLPPWGLTGTGDASAIFPVTGRYYYAGARFKF